MSTIKIVDKNKYGKKNNDQKILNKEMSTKKHDPGTSLIF